MKIKLYSQYPHFTMYRKPKYIEWTKKETTLHCYVNEWTSQVQKYDPRAIALILEPRTILPEVYTFMEQHWNNFRYVFTHDSKLLKMADNAKLLLFGGVWESSPQEKTKDISMISSNKTMCPLHIARINLARQLEGKIDTFGSYKNSPWVSTGEAHGPYKFAVVVENNIDDYYFTEKICNCFANKTIPIYVGARKISQFFNPEGIIEATIEEIPTLIEVMDCDKTYKGHLEAVEDNFNRVKDFWCFEDWFYKTYESLLEELENDIIDNYTGV